jgi:protein-disulfide isomerase
MERETVRKTVVRDVALAAELDIRGTPSVFLNGRRVPDLCLNNPIFWEAISAAFQRPGRVATLSDACKKPEASPDEEAVAGTGKVNR